MIRLIPNKELVTHDEEDALKIASILLKNNNAVLLTKEENLTVVNWVYCWDGEADRNEVVFMHRNDFEEYIDEEISTIANESEDFDPKAATEAYVEQDL